MDEEAYAFMCEAFAAMYNRPEQIDGEKGERIDNPVSKPQFALDRVQHFIEEVCNGYKVQLGQVEAQKAVEAINAKMANTKLEIKVNE